MIIQRGEIALPERAQAIDRISDFNDLDPTEISDYKVLANALGGLSLAVSSLAREFGAEHPLPGIKNNIGMWTRIGEGEDQHKFTAQPQDRTYPDLNGASIWRAPVVSTREYYCTEKYYDHVVIPTDRVMSEFLATDPAELHQGWDMPSWTDIYATRNRGPEGIRLNYWPFNRPLDRAEGLPSVEESAQGYTQILQDLSKTLLDIIEE